VIIRGGEKGGRGWEELASTFISGLDARRHTVSGYRKFAAGEYAPCVYVSRCLSVVCLLRII